MSRADETTPAGQAKPDRHDIKQAIEDICANVLPEHAGIYDLEIHPGGGDYRVVLVLDNLEKTVGSFSSDEMADFARSIQAGLEPSGLDERCSLELSTPGLERSLRSWEDARRFVGHLTQLAFTSDVEVDTATGQGKVQSGVFRIQAVGPGDTVHLQIWRKKGNSSKGKKKAIQNDHLDYTVDWSRVIKARLYIDF